MVAQSVDLDSAALTPEQVSERGQQAAEAAKHFGLPPIGARMMNRHGIGWQVVNHGLFPLPAGLAKDSSNGDYLPLIRPTNISERLVNFINETNHCTSKQILFIDTMPAPQPFSVGENVHYAICSSNPDASYILLDAANAHETSFAHEIAHLWLKYVQEGGDGMRRLREEAWDNARYMQLNFVQSFVLDLKVNDLIAERGFDVSRIMEDCIQALTSLKDAVALGYQPPTSREALLHSLGMAGAVLEQEQWSVEQRQHLAELLAFFEATTPKTYQMALELAGIVRHHGYGSQEAIRKTLDECITLAFHATGDDFDIDRDLEESALVEGMQDKYPGELPGCPVPLKLEIAKTLARNGISFPCKVLINAKENGTVEIMTENASGTKKGPLAVNYQVTARRFLAHRNAAPQRSPLTDGLAPDRYGRIPGDPLFNSGHPTSHDSVRSVRPLSSMSPALYWSDSAPHYMAGVALSVSRSRLAQQMTNSTNLYQYVYNSPVIYRDPTGFGPPPQPSSTQRFRAVYPAPQISGGCNDLLYDIWQYPEFYGPPGLFVQKLTFSYSISNCNGEPVLEDTVAPKNGSQWYEATQLTAGNYIIDTRHIRNDVRNKVGWIEVTFETGIVAGQSLDPNFWTHDGSFESGISGSDPINKGLPTGMAFTTQSSGFIKVSFNCCCQNPYARGTVTRS